jgi:signal transduction histidine kinase
LGARRADELRELDGLRREVAAVRASRARLALAADAERRSLEHDLHEGVQQLLVGLAANLELAAGSVDADPAATKELLAEMGRDTRQAIEESRRLAHRIYPPLLETGGLVAALRSVAASANVPTRIDVATGTDSPAEVAGTVYFCFLVVLERAAAGTPVAITVRDEAGALAFEVVADGDVDADRLRLRDRVEALGGRVTIRSGSGQTRVIGSLPRSG